MKTIILLIVLFFTQILNALDSVEVFDDWDPYTFNIAGDYAYLSDSTLNRSFKVIDKFTRAVEDPLDDYFFWGTPSDLYEKSIKYYLITVDKEGHKNLFVVDEMIYNIVDIGEYFKFQIFWKTQESISDLGNFSDEELDFILTLKD